MSKIVSISSSVPAYQHRQMDIFSFMEKVYQLNPVESRKLRFLYSHSGIEYRYSVLPDYSKAPDEWIFYPPTNDIEPFPSLELRMQWYDREACVLSVNAIESCLRDVLPVSEITHLITVSCTGMSAPGLDLQILEALNLPATITRTSVNFMGCYAAIHGLKLADAFCKTDPQARVLVVCTELCTLHFQKENTMDNLASSLLFGDGAAAVLVTPDVSPFSGLLIENFYSEVALNGKNDMSWKLSSSGFLMTLSGYVPELIEKDFKRLVTNALANAGKTLDDISHWCIHPGGKRILSAISKSIGIDDAALSSSYKVLNDYGNMSSPTILFVLKDLLEKITTENLPVNNVFGAAFGPGLTMETFLLRSQRPEHE